MDGRAFAKCMRDAGLLDNRLHTTDVDLIFAQCKAKGKRKIGLATFRKALSLIAARKGWTQKEVVAMVCQTKRPAYHSCADEAPSHGTGPERLFYDKASYTGTHRNGGPKTVGGVGIIGVQELLNRDLILEDSLQRRKSLERSLSTSSLGRSQSPSRGPERFFYDKSSYTGTHRRGGPNMVGSGRDAPKEPYADFSALVDRDHVQDDALQRRKRTSSPARISSPQRTSSPPRRSLSVHPEMSQSQPLPVLLGGRFMRVSDKEGCEIQGKANKDQAVEAAPIFPRRREVSPPRGTGIGASAGDEEKAAPLNSARQELQRFHERLSEGVAQGDISSSDLRRVYALLSSEMPMLDTAHTKATPMQGPALAARFTRLPPSAQTAPPCASSSEATFPRSLSPPSRYYRMAQVPELLTYRYASMGA